LIRYLTKCASHCRYGNAKTGIIRRVCKIPQFQLAVIFFSLIRYLTKCASHCRYGNAETGIIRRVCKIPQFQLAVIFFCLIRSDTYWILLGKSQNQNNLNFSQKY
jgi:hypothetical protein